jgi:hypothetical protein
MRNVHKYREEKQMVTIFPSTQLSLFDTPILQDFLSQLLLLCYMPRESNDKKNTSLAVAISVFYL